MVEFAVPGLTYFVLAKSGVDPEQCVDVCKHIVESCPQLKLSGLMTIGMFGRDPNVENPDFKVTLLIVLCIPTGFWQFFFITVPRRL